MDWKCPNKNVNMLNLDFVAHQESASNEYHLHSMDINYIYEGKYIDYIVNWPDAGIMYTVL